MADAKKELHEETVAGVNVTGEVLKSRDKQLIGRCVLALGGLTVQQLLQRGGIAIFLNGEDAVEIAPLGEVALDGLEEDDAIMKLVSRDYSDESIKNYLKARQARLASAY